MFGTQVDPQEIPNIKMKSSLSHEWKSWADIRRSRKHKLKYGYIFYVSDANYNGGNARKFFAIRKETLARMKSEWAPKCCNWSQKPMHFHYQSPLVEKFTEVFLNAVKSAEVVPI